MIRLPLHRPQPAHLPHQPALHLPIFRRVPGIRELILLVISLHQIIQDRAALKHAQRLPFAGAGEAGIRERRDAAVWVDLEEPRLLLLVGGEVEFRDVVGEAELLEEDGGLDAVGGLLGVEVEGGFGRHCGGGGVEGSGGSDGSGEEGEAVHSMRWWNAG